MRYLTISNSDGDTGLYFHDSMEEVEDWIGEACVYGPEMIEKEADTNYWPEGSYVLLEVP